MRDSNEKQVESALGRWMTRAKAAVSGSRWAGLTGKAAAYVGAFALLALVGSGRVSAWLSPPARLVASTVPAAQAATALPSASAAPSASTSAAPADGGAPEGANAEPKPASDADAGAPASGVAADGKVILNLATEEDLRRLPGVGATRARAILALRGRMKRFGRVEDLLKVKGLGRRSLARLRPLVRID
ncbi:Late competence protein ComEA, DNA receptor [Minicystis rosea]|nr:Late competence protein ComEA, DNA receptor [Minicystis rosea]